MVKCADSQKYSPNMLQVITRDFSQIYLIKFELKNFRIKFSHKKKLLDGNSSDLTKVPQEKCV